MNRSATVALAAALACGLCACEEDKKEPAKTAAATPAPAPAPTPEKTAQPDEKAEAPAEKSALEKCCMALGRGAFSVQGPERRFFAKAAQECRDAVEKKQELPGVKGKIKKALGSATVPPDCQ